MSKLAGKSGLRSRNNDTEKKKVTTVHSNNNVTTSTGPTTMRLPPKVKGELAEWLDALQAQTDKKLTPAKLFRGLIAMRANINDKKLLDSIKDVT